MNGFKRTFKINFHYMGGDQGYFQVFDILPEAAYHFFSHEMKRRTGKHARAPLGKPAQVLAAAAWGAGLAAAVRLDASLRRDAVIAWDETLRVRWAWPLPTPARPRIAPVGLAAAPDADGGVIVFYDGRFAARLPP